MPRQALPDDVSSKFANLALADPSFASPSPIDLLLGADIFSSVLDGKRVMVDDLCPVAFGSVFGWILIGPIPSSHTTDNFSTVISLTTSVETLIDKFWRVEEPDAAPDDFTEEGKCESIFLSGTSRMPDGRFSVPLPFRGETSPETFRGSRAIAMKRFENLERKLSTDSRLRDLYVDFMREYESLGHMSLASSPGHYIIPHHAVYRASDLNPKIRVVFDASATASSGISLNNCLLTGPKLQVDVVDILLLFRLPRFAFTTDVCKMYRQILVAPEFRPYQHILWRYSPTAELKEYVLNTVTYGVNCAPYIAMRVLKAVAETECADFPAVREALLRQTYVDDVCTGADTVEEVLKLQTDLVSVLHQAGFELKKWSSNCQAVLDTVPISDWASESSSFENGDCVGVKVLGLQWEHIDDHFRYAIQADNVVTTKRGMLSLIARVFDPLGLLAPTIFLAKHFMQRVWMANVSWDEQLPAELGELWHSFVLELGMLSKVKIPRFLGTCVRQKVSLCGFCDASERGYAAVVYIRLEGASDQVRISLVGAKTKLAPIKPSTIPRLELCAAVLLAKWMHRIQETFSSRLDIGEIFAWSDSAIVLSWLKSTHKSFKIFVSNRIHQIHSLLPDCRWNHIRSSDNPADSASRGLFPTELLTCDLYWNGPACLYMAPTTWNTEIPILSTEFLPECKLPPPVALVSQADTEWFSRFSSYTRMLSVVAWIRRFVNYCRRHQLLLRGTCLTRSELDEAAIVIIRSSQRFSFSQLFRELSNGSPISSRPVARLRPFINSQEIICVGGRIRHSDLTDSQKFPILLSKTSYMSTLIIRHWHRFTCHGGPRILSSLIGRHFWILSMRSLIRSVISKCVRCVRVSAVNPQPVMADLPHSRVTECRPFSRVGIDFAGPIRIKENRLRKARDYKTYIAVFVCFVVKAVHLEVVTDLSTNAFLAALDRFVARRGLPTDIYSDCGTNFVGAAKQLRELINMNRDLISAAVHCTWHFNPPSAPHFGGLWEAAVRSTKSLMTKVMGEHLFTLEEFMTITCRIESILNSRPLTPISNDPSDLECLTPGHFLIGQPLLAVPDSNPGATLAKVSLTNRWTLINQCFQAFWKRWRTEYLQTLQSRGRWTIDQPSLNVNDMVVIKESNTPPLTWQLGRIIDVMPGRDGVVRVARVQTKQGIRVRPVVKLVKLPTT